MNYYPTLEQFLADSANHDEIRYMIASLASKHQITSVEDMMHEVYLWFLQRNILGRFNPSYRHKGRLSKISTYLYPIIQNVIRSRKSDNESQICKNRFLPPQKASKYGGYLDEVEVAMRYSDLAVEYENIVEQNEVSDSLEGLGSDLADFEERFLPLENKTYKLRRRRDKDVDTQGCSLLQVYRLLKEGYTSHEISQNFGISDMFASTLKHEIAEALLRYGINPNGHRKNRKAPNDRAKMPKVQSRS